MGRPFSPRLLEGDSLRRRLRFFIDAGFVEGLWLADGQGSGLSVEFLEETTQVSGVAGAAGLLDLKEEHIAVTIRKPATDFLRVTTGLTLEPEFFSRATPIVHEAGLERLLEGFAIHPGEHQHAPARGVSRGSLLNDCGNETFGGEFEIEFHCCRIADCRLIGNVA